MPAPATTTSARSECSEGLDRLLRLPLTKTKSDDGALSLSWGVVLVLQRLLAVVRGRMTKPDACVQPLCLRPGGELCW